MILNWKQKILLNILHKCKELSRLKLFKLGFLLSREEPFYDFVLYKFEPHSFEMERDLRNFHQQGWISTQNQTIIISNLYDKVSVDYSSKISLDKILLYSQWKKKDLLKYIYNKYPYYTHNSQIKSVQYKIPSPQIAIYSIGYQGLSIDGFIDVLVKKGIRTLLDVRYKPRSYKYGFNSYWLAKYLPEFGIKYKNIPELGIEDRIRKSSEKKNLWKYYTMKLKKNNELVHQVIDTINSEPTVLMCCEPHPNDCHRLQLSQKIQQLTKLPIIDYNRGFKRWKKLS